jgi:hypothetical protein
MSHTFKPKYVPSEVIARWPAMAFALWKRSFKHQAGMLLVAALALKFLPAWSAVIAFLIAPSMFFICFAAVQIADEKVMFSWHDLADTALSGALKLGYISMQFAACFGLGIAALSLLVFPFLPDPSAAKQTGLFEGSIGMQAATTSAAFDSSQNQVVEFLYFFASWTDGIMAMMFLGLFIVAIYQGVFGVFLHAQEEMNTRVSRTYGWQAWQINSESIESAVRAAPPRFFSYLAIIIFTVICEFQIIYLAPIGILLATYIPSLAYVAYRSIFFAKHENVAASNRVAARASTHGLVPAWQRF